MPNDKVEFCDDRHQAIAFTGGCPICRSRVAFLPLPQPGGTRFISELKRELRRYHDDAPAPGQLDLPVDRG